MSKSPVNITIGRNLRSLRTLRHMTAEDLSSALAEKCGVNISPDAIFRYERGDQPLTVENKLYFSIALNCSREAIEDGIDPRNAPAPEARTREIRMLSAEEHQIFRHIATDWRGDPRALILAVGCYAALPEAYALRAIMGIMAEVTRALAAHAITPADLPHGLPYLEERIGHLCREVGDCNG